MRRGEQAVLGKISAGELPFAASIWGAVLRPAYRMTWGTAVCATASPLSRKASKINADAVRTAQLMRFMVLLLVVGGCSLALRGAPEASTAVTPILGY
jgi:hypothetical protein